MNDLSALIREYCDLLDQERQLGKRKSELRAAIQAELNAQALASSQTRFGTAERRARFKLVPRRDEVLDLLDRGDLFDFAQFPSTKVRDLLVPKYGRERLLPLFDVEKTEYLVVRRPGSAEPAEDDK